MLEIGKLYSIPFFARYDNANEDDRNRCKEIIGIENNTIEEAEEYSRLDQIHLDPNTIVMVIEIGSSVKSAYRESYTRLKLICEEKVVEVYVPDCWISGFKLVTKAI